MRLQTIARRCTLTGTALAVGLAGLALGQGPASDSHASAPVGTAQAGPVAVWGPGDTADDLSTPELTDVQKSEAFTKVVANGFASAIALTMTDYVMELMRVPAGPTPPAGPAA